MYRTSWITACLLSILLMACKEEKKPLLDTEKVEVDDFIDFFPELKLPFLVADTSLPAKSPDSLRIGNKIFAQFVPDSILHPVFGKKSKPKIYPIGKLEVEDGETYLFVKAVLAQKRTAYLLVFDKEIYKTVLPLVTISGTPKEADRNVATMDSRYTITTLRQRTAADGQVVYNKKVYVYNTEGVFTMILTESNDKDAASAVLLNPIDTLKATHKLSGDYIRDKKNVLSFRDGRTEGTLMFFVHFEKDGGECRGELKGEANITGKNTARYTETNGPCLIDFTFSGNTVTMKELEGCGSYRDIKCFFEGSFTRKKKATPPANKKKK
ncbi:hypothetical protein [Flavihumibacter sp.]|uniref:hypothetical protein n=1 Tax=Flavihumibacter sp. TaxID=1913981 RepID=UPI002FCA80CE